MLFESTATKVTSARPIISAAAVAAVRPGSAALRRARKPETPASLSPGTPTIAAIGRTSFDEIIATPTKSRRTPKAIESRRDDAQLVRERAASSSRSATTSKSSAT